MKKPFLLYYDAFLNKSNIGHRLHLLSSPFLNFLQHLDLQFSEILILVRNFILSFFLDFVLNCKNLIPAQKYIIFIYSK